MPSSTIIVPASPAGNNDPYVSLDSNPVSGSRQRNAAQVLAIGVITRPTKYKMTANENSLLEKSKDVSEASKAPAAPAVGLRWRKGSSKPVRIIMKNFLLPVLLVLSAWTILKGTETIRKSVNSPFAALDYEVRISEVEESLKRTTKMLEDWLEVVDEKIGSELESTAKDLRKLVEKKGVVFGKELRKVEARTDTLDKSMKELKGGMGLLSKKEFEIFLDELKNSGILDGGDKLVSLDDVRALARDIVEEEIEKHAADGLGRADYAVASGGSRVVRHSEPYDFVKANSWLAAVRRWNRVHPNAQKMLQPSFGEPGQCFPLQGSRGFVEIRLRTGIIPEAITLEHVSKSVAYDRSSAPKDCQVFAWFEGPEDDQANRSDKMNLLTEFSYDLEKSNAQTFSVETSNSGVINMVRLEFSSNHGSSSLTCVYRLRVHGYEPNSFTAYAMED